MILTCRTLLEEYCDARKALGADEGRIGNLNEKVKDLVQALEKRLGLMPAHLYMCRAFMFLNKFIYIFKHYGHTPCCVPFLFLVVLL